MEDYLMKKNKEWKVHGGTVTQYEHLSDSTKTKMVFSVFLPSVSEGTKVPALYYLSGLTCTDQNFITKAAPYAMAAAYGIAIVAPDTSPRGANIEGENDSWDFGTGAGFYVDATEAAWKKNYNMYSYVTKELPALIESELPITTKKSIFGHSMGGHGALICYLKNSGMYTSCSAFAPICNPVHCPWGEKAFNGYLGSDKKAWEAYDATCLVKNYTGQKYEILIDQGNSDGFLKKKQLLPENFVEACKAVNFPVKLRMQTGYDHSYFFIHSFINDHIEHHAKALGCVRKQITLSMDCGLSKKDLVDLKNLLKHSKSARIKKDLTKILTEYSACLGEDVQSIEANDEGTDVPVKDASPSKDDAMMDEGSAVPKAKKEVKQAIPENMPQRIKSVKRQKKQIRWQSIAEYAWDQNDSFVKVIIGKKYMLGVGQIDKENVKCEFEEEGFILSVTNLNGKNYKLTMKNLSKDYVQDKSKIWIGKNKVIVKLRKVKEKYGPDRWYDLTSKTKFKPNKNTDKDPTAGLMDMMKKMYDDGDDKMKETIGKAMYESRMKQAQGGGGFEPPSMPSMPSM